MPSNPEYEFIAVATRSSWQVVLYMPKNSINGNRVVCHKVPTHGAAVGIMRHLNEQRGNTNTKLVDMLPEPWKKYVVEW